MYIGITAVDVENAMNCIAENAMNWSEGQVNVNVRDSRRYPQIKKERLPMYVFYFYAIMMFIYLFFVT